jgi:hypothetical protein
MRIAAIGVVLPNSEQGKKACRARGDAPDGTASWQPVGFTGQRESARWVQSFIGKFWRANAAESTTVPPAYVPNSIRVQSPAKTSILRSMDPVSQAWIRASRPMPPTTTRSVRIG